jgi:hypothetical protein
MSFKHFVFNFFVQEEGGKKFEFLPKGIPAT